MIEKIIMKQVASYEEATIHTKAKVNLFYGLNGAGKSTIARFLKSLKRGRLSNYSQCAVKPESSRKYFVYNQEFIQENFYEGQQKGVFTVGEDAREIEKEIEALEKNFNEKSVEIEEINKKKIIENEKRNEAENRKIEALFRYKKDNESSALKSCMQGFLNNKEKFAKQVEEFSQVATTDTFEELENELSELINNKGEKVEHLSKPEFLQDVSRLEENPILKEEIIAIGESRLKSLVDALQNSSWIKQGQGYLERSEGLCPFCQEPVEKSLQEDITQLFNEEYENAIQNLDRTVDTYNKLMPQLESYASQVDTSQYLDQAKFNLVIANLTTRLRKNLDKIKEKQRAPELVIELEPSGELIFELNIQIEEANRKITDLNSRLDKFDESKADITRRFWQLVRNLSDKDIQDYRKVARECQRKIADFEQEIGAIETAQADLDKQIKQKRKETTNIEEVKEKLNIRLQTLGLEGFEIVADEQNKGMYRLNRTNGSNGTDVYKTLSEGEKTLITFLYFLEVSLGATKGDEVIDLAERIIVIDDPISSLSHNYIYDIAHLIRDSYFLKNENLNVKQLFVLTHNLYFMHELLRQFPTNSNKKLIRVLHRVNKVSGKSQVTKLEERDIQNEYQAFWEVLKDFKKGDHELSFIVANSMRNIIEHFFGFMHKKSSVTGILNFLKKEMPDIEPLFRYMNRQSHSDAINFSRFRDIRAERFFKMFRRIFKEAGYLEHYKAMMDEK